MLRLTADALDEQEVKHEQKRTKYDPNLLGKVQAGLEKCKEALKQFTDKTFWDELLDIVIQGALRGKSKLSFWICSISFRFRFDSIRFDFGLVSIRFDSIKFKRLRSNRGGGSIQPIASRAEEAASTLT